VATRSRERPGRSTLAVLGLLASALVLGCATSAPRPAPAPPAAALEWGVPAEDLPLVALYRLEASSAAGSVTLRVALRMASAERFEAAASDLFGRPVWRLLWQQGSGVWIDHRGRDFCRLAATREVTLPDFGLELQAPELPAILLGRLPAAPAGGVAGSSTAPASALRFLDAAGRRWSADLDERGVARWTLWRDDEPALWWRREERGGTLSARAAGAQVRYRELSRSRPESAPELAPPPPDYRETSCDGSGLP
jgi:hypothetical protein